MLTRSDLEAMRVERLLAGIPVEAYRQAADEGRHMLVRGAVGEDTLGRLFSLARFDEIVATHGLRHPEIMVIADDASTPPPTGPGGFIDSSALGARVRGGSTVRMRAVEEHDASVNAACVALGDSLDRKVSAVAFLTPVRTQAFTPHYDERDVWIVQIHGSKRWRLHRAAPGFEPRLLPNPDEPFDASVHQAGDLIEEVVIHAGDAMFLPRGTIHSVSSVDEPSLHIGMSWLPLTLADVAMRCVRTMQLADVRLRHGLRHSDLSDEAGRRGVAALLLLHGIDVEPGVLAQVADDMLESYVGSVLPMRQGAIARAVEVVGADVGRHYEYLSPTTWRTVESDGGTALLLRDGRYDMGRGEMDVLRDLASRGRGDLDDLVVRFPEVDVQDVLDAMVDAGLLRCCPAPD